MNRIAKVVRESYIRETLKDLQGLWWEQSSDARKNLHREKVQELCASFHRADFKNQSAYEAALSKAYAELHKNIERNFLQHYQEKVQPQLQQRLGQAIDALNPLHMLSAIHKRYPWMRVDNTLAPAKLLSSWSYQCLFALVEEQILHALPEDGWKDLSVAALLSKPLAIPSAPEYQARTINNFVFENLERLCAQTQAYPCMETQPTTHLYPNRFKQQVLISENYH